MDIFKLIFEHDLRLDNLADRPASQTDQTPSQTLEEFMRPDPTYSKFYLTGTLLEGPAFGLSVIDRFQPITRAVDEALSAYIFYTKDGEAFDTLGEALNHFEIGEPLIGARGAFKGLPDNELTIDDLSNIGQRKTALRHALEGDLLVIYKEKAHDGYDLHIFSKANLYRDLFYPLKELTGGANYRFFSVNGKRMRSEKHFYFETWTLDRPPHGAEEVFPETVL